MRGHSLWVGVLLFAGVAIGQKRVRVAGQALAKDGRPWTGCTVVLLSRPIRTVPPFHPPDRVAAVTDEKGHFRARILPERRYSAWATSEPRAGRFRISAIREDVVSGTALSLREQQTLVQVRVRVQGRPAWKREEPLRFQFVSEAPDNVEIRPVTLDGKNECLVPPLPSRSVFLETFGNTGKRLYRERVWLDPRERALRAIKLNGKALLPADFTAIKVPAPVSVIVKVAEHGRNEAPLGDVRFLQFVRGKAIPWARTDGTGRVRLDLPLEHQVYGRFESSGLEFLVRGPGRSTFLTGEAWEIPFGIHRDTDRMWRKGACDRIIDLRSIGSPVQGRITRKGRPVANLRLVVHQSAETRDSRKVVPLLLETDENGRFSTVSRVDSAFRVTAMHSGQLAILAAAPGPPTGALDIELADLRSLRVDVRRPDGFPAKRPLVRLFHVTRGTRTLGEPIELRADRRGEIRALVATGFEPLVLANQGDRFAFASPWVATHTGLKCEACLTPPRVVSGILKDAKGNPLPARELRAMAPHRRLSPRAAALLRSGVVRTHSDAAGRFRFALPPGDYRSLRVGRRLFRIGVGDINGPPMQLEVAPKK